MHNNNYKLPYNSMARRFRGFLPVVVDVETGGLDPNNDALLELAALPILMHPDGSLYPGELQHYHIMPFAGANISKESLEINQIDPTHPFRFAVTEEVALLGLFNYLNALKTAEKCSKCVLVGHNSWFDLHFLNAASKRCNISGPFHSFTSFDTATLSAIFYGQTALSQAAKRAKIQFDPTQHHSAIYDVEKTAELFCKITNLWLTAKSKL